MTDEKRITAKVPGDMHRAARIKAAQEGANLSDLMRAWLAAWLNGELPKAEQSPKPSPQAQA